MSELSLEKDVFGPYHSDEIEIITFAEGSAGALASADAQVAYVRNRIREYLERLHQISAASTPPGTNAANGWWREYSVNDTFLVRDCAAPTAIPLQGESTLLFAAYTYFHSLVQRAFNSCGNHGATWSSSGQIFFPGAASVAGEILAVLNDILQIIGASDAKKEAAKTHLAKDISNLVDAVKNNGYVWSGAHANGWISVYMRDAGIWTIQNHLDKHFPKGKNTKAGQAADVLRSVCSNLAALPTDNHKPWLRAEWQIRYQGIMQSGAIGLRS